MSLITISCCAGGAIFLLIIAIKAKIKVKITLQNEQTIFIWNNWTETVYTLLFGNTPPEKILRAFGLEYDKYMLNCDILGRKPDLQKEAAYRVVGVFGIVFGLVLTIILRNPVPIICGVLLYFLLAAGIPRFVEMKAADKKAEFSLDIVRFMDLLLSALQIGLPIDTALMATSESLNCVLGEEMKVSLAETQIGAKSWQGALEGIARKYEVDMFSDLVVDIVASYEKGVDITETVERKNIELKQSQVIIAKEKTAQLSTSILAPVSLFKLFPLIIIMLLPILVQIFTVFA